MLKLVTASKEARGAPNSSVSALKGGNTDCPGTTVSVAPAVGLAARPGVWVGLIVGIGVSVGLAVGLARAMGDAAQQSGGETGSGICAWIGSPAQV